MIVTEARKSTKDIEASFSPDCEEYCVFAANYVWAKQIGERLVIVVRPKVRRPAARPLGQVGIDDPNATTSTRGSVVL